MKRIYLDNAASTPMAPEVIREMARVMEEFPGNASSLHTDGTRAKDLLEKSRMELAFMIGCLPEEIIFTSGGTESNNLALKGYALANHTKGNHIIISSIEHDCILNTCKWLERLGFRITLLPVDEKGRVDTGQVRGSLEKGTLLISVMHINNEIGTIQPLEEIGRIAKENNIVFHTDACQSFGKIPIDLSGMNLDMVSFNAHKIYGPKGVGALYIRKGLTLEPILHGGGQERGYRSTTENIPGIAGFIKAAQICQANPVEEYRHIETLKKRLTDQLSSYFDNIYYNSPLNAFPGILNFSFSGREGDAIHLLLMLDEAGISLSTGSACSSNHEAGSGSHVLNAIGRNPIESRGAIRVSVGRYNTEKDIDSFCDILKRMNVRLKPIYSI